MPTIETSENKPRYGPAPSVLISAARRSRMVTNTCAPRKMKSPRISRARPMMVSRCSHTQRTAASVRPRRDHGAPLHLVNDAQGLRPIPLAALQIAGGIDQKLTLLERHHVVCHGGGAAVACDGLKHALHGLD